MYKFRTNLLFLILVVCATATGCSKTNYTGYIPGSGNYEEFAASTPSPIDYELHGAASKDSEPIYEPSATPAPAASSVPDPTKAPTVVPEPTEAPTPTPTPAPTATPVPTRVPDTTFKGSLAIPSDITGIIEKYEYLRKTINNNAAYYDNLDNYNPGTWCFKRMKDHSQSGTYEYFKIADYNGCYVNPNVTDDDKVIYLTFDCGYPSALTEKILDTLAAHNAKATFFVTKMYLKECSDYAIRMKQEGHMVCNHTVSHSDLTNMSVEKIMSEIFDCSEYFYEQTGYEFDPYFRTPSGAYTKRLMTLISDAGMKTVFWSIAYGDYDKNNQPAPGYVTDHFTAYHHNGAIALMHNDSTSNANELDAVLTLLEKEGYRFGLLDELP